MTFTSKQQDKFRNDFVDKTLQKAWDTFCQLSFLDKDIQSRRAEVSELESELSAIDDKLKDIDPALKHGEDRTKAQDEIKSLNTRKVVVSSQLHGTGRRIGTRNDGSPAEDHGLQGQLHELTMVAIQHQAEAVRYMALAAHAQEWSFEQAKKAA